MHSHPTENLTALRSNPDQSPKARSFPIRFPQQDLTVASPPWRPSRHGPSACGGWLRPNQPRLPWRCDNQTDRPGEHPSIGSESAIGHQRRVRRVLKPRIACPADSATQPASTARLCLSARLSRGEPHTAGAPRNPTLRREPDEATSGLRCVLRKDVRTCGTSSLLLPRSTPLNTEKAPILPVWDPRSTPVALHK